MKALILDNNVVDVVAEEFPVGPDFTWMDCSDDCRAGHWEVKDGKLSEIPITKKDYAEQRKKEYNAILGEYLDGIVKDDQTQIDKYIADCKAIKAKWPKDNSGPIE